MPDSERSTCDPFWQGSSEQEYSGQDEIEMAECAAETALLPPGAPHTLIPKPLYLSDYLSIFVSIYLYLSVYLSISIYRSIYLSIYLSIHIYIYIDLSIYIYIYVYMYTSTVGPYGRSV